MEGQQTISESVQEQIKTFISSDKKLCVLDLKSPRTRLIEDVSKGFATQGKRFLPSTYLYDKQGSEIYEEITKVSEYYPTRTEAAILESSSRAIRQILGHSRIIELGSGSSEKTRILFDAWEADKQKTLYIPIDVSLSMLQESAKVLISEYKKLQVLALAGRYETGLAAIPPSQDSLVTFLGGTIGNFEAEAQRLFFTKLAKRMYPGSFFLLGFDRRAHPNKPAEVIRKAYNDTAGVTSRFNLNMLTRLNRELKANFVLENFRHDAIYSEKTHQIEMYLESLCEQTVEIKELSKEYSFGKGERILTEISRKFDPDSLTNWFVELGFEKEEFFSDPKELFGLLLLRRV